MEPFEKVFLAILGGAIGAVFLIYLIHMGFKSDCVKTLKDKAAAEIRVVCYG